MRVLLAVAAVLVSCVSAGAQVTVGESGIRAHLIEGKTAITLPVHNSFRTTVEARVDLEWRAAHSAEDGQATKTLALPPGDSVVEVPLPIGEKIKPFEERLSYRLRPSFANLTSFEETHGFVSLVNIADYAFTLQVVSPAFSRSGVPVEIQVLASDPKTGKPVSGVTITRGSMSAVTGENGLAHFMVTLDQDEDLSREPVKGAKGDFRESVEVKDVRKYPGSTTIHLDKPIYQPGQTMHVRILAFGTDGKAHAGTAIDLKIENDDGDVEYAAKLTTSAYGIATADWEISASAKAGQYVLNASAGESDFVATQEVPIRRYELPSFTVTARGLRPYYLPGQMATVEVSANYLFGRAVAKGSVRITEGADDDAKEFAHGPLDAKGLFRKSFPMKGLSEAGRLFEDRHFVAFVTDATTNRTEQKKFDVRISKQALHIYEVRQEARAAGQRLYITTYSAAGEAVPADVTVSLKGKTLARAKSNRFGIARIDLGKNEGPFLIRARLGDGREGTLVTQAAGDSLEVWLDVERRVCAPGDSIRGTIRAKRADFTAHLTVWNAKGAMVYSQPVKVTAGKGEFQIPYEERFGRELGIAVVLGEPDRMLTTTVVYPGEDELRLKATAARKEYAPGETAHLEFAASSKAALGIAVVDQSVRERAATDDAFGKRGRRPFFDRPAVERMGGMSYSDLLHMDPRKIDADVELLGELLLPTFMLNDSYTDARAEAESAYQSAIQKSLEPFRQKLDVLYRDELQYPKSLTAYLRVGGKDLADPWLQPYDVRFNVERNEDVMELWSAGPDKIAGTGDDFLALQIRRKWFARFESLMRDALQTLEDYPATPEEFLRRFEQAGLNFTVLRDPWNSPLRLKIEHQGDRRSLLVMSAGPDRKFGTNDDFAVCQFSGTYFTAIGNRIDEALSKSKDFPATEENLFALARKAGVDLDRLRDPWGRRYYAQRRTQEMYYDKVSFYTYAEYGRVEETRKQLTPTRHTLLEMQLRSAGPDGRRGTWDDFTVYSFFRVLDKAANQQASEPVPPSSQPHAQNGKGTILGTVTDINGAAIAGARVTLKRGYFTETDAAGKYYFADLARGLYRLTFAAPGFQRGEGVQVPCEPDHVTKFDFALQVGTVSQTIDVTAGAPIVETLAAKAASLPPKQTSTPKLREYFPETLYWQPELVTDALGHASVDVKLADTITNWRVAVMASTIDGQVTETETDVRAFQPFQVDLDMPPVLTVGDQITLPAPVRNYTDRAQLVVVNATADSGLTVEEASERAYTVGQNSTTQTRMPLRAAAASEKAKLQVSAVGGAAADAIAKTTRIHPDGELMSKSITGALSGEQYLEIEVPQRAISGSVRGEVKIYPSLLARLLEAAEALLQRPWGCGEQTISSTYPNLLVLQALKQTGIHDSWIESKAQKNLRKGYERLLTYQSEEGGFRYWPKGEPNAPLTSYALRFLREARAVLDIDENRVKRAETWLQRQPTTGADDSVTLDRLTQLAKKSAEFDDPYEMAMFASAAMDLGKKDLAATTIRRLSEMAQDEQGAAYWAMRTNTPFHGWGRTGQVETTAIVIATMAKWNAAELKPLLDRGILFLLRNTDRHGAWGSGQATVRALMALLATMDSNVRAMRSIDVILNGAVVQTLAVKEDEGLRGPMVLDLSKLLRPGVNQIRIGSREKLPTQVQLNAEWYEPWAQAHLTDDFALTTKFTSNSVKVNESVKCQVTVSRPSFRGYGMMIAEVGLPPGAEVDRGSLEGTLAKVDSYEVAPDHVTFYVWPQAKDLQFEFLFRPRFPMNARMAESVLYDYYNPDVRTVLVPGSFTAR